MLEKFFWWLHCGNLIIRICYWFPHGPDRQAIYRVRELAQRLWFRRYEKRLQQRLRQRESEYRK